MLNDVRKPQQQHGPLGHSVDNRERGVVLTRTGCWPWPTQSKASVDLELDPLS